MTIHTLDFNTYLRQSILKGFISAIISTAKFDSRAIVHALRKLSASWQGMSCSKQGLESSICKKNASVVLPYISRMRKITGWADLKTEMDCAPHKTSLQEGRLKEGEQKWINPDKLVHPLLFLSNSDCIQGKSPN